MSSPFEDDLAAALMAPSTSLHQSESGVYSHDGSSNSMQQQSVFLANLAHGRGSTTSAVPSTVRKFLQCSIQHSQTSFVELFDAVGAGVSTVVDSLSNLVGGRSRDRPSVVLSNVKYDTSSDRFSEWMGKPDDDHVELTSNFADKKKTLVENICLMESGIVEESNKIHELKVHMNHLVAARELAKEKIRGHERVKKDKEGVVSKLRQDLEDLEMKYLITNDYKNLKCQIFRVSPSCSFLFSQPLLRQDMPSPTILEKLGLQTDADWAKLGQRGATTVARKLVRLGYLNNKECPVKDVAQCHGIIGVTKEGTSKYIKYLQSVLNYKPDDVREALRNEEEPKLQELMEKGVLKPGMPESYKRTLLDLLAKNPSDYTDEDIDECAPPSKKARREERPM